MNKLLVFAVCGALALASCDQASVQYYRDQMVKVRDGVVYITASREPITTERRRDYKHDPAGTEL